MRHAAVLTLACALATSVAAQGPVTKYVRYAHTGATSYGILEGDQIRELRGDIFANPSLTGRSVNSVTLGCSPPANQGRSLRWA
jgi:hypothetical protein